MVVHLRQPTPTGDVESANPDAQGSARGSSQIDTTTFNPTSVAQHYSTHIGHNTPSIWAGVGGETEDVFNLARHFRSSSPSLTSRSPTSTQAGQNFFPETDRYDVDQSVNFMDHSRANYTQPARKKAPAPPKRTSTRESFVSIFLGSKRGSTSTTGTAISRASLTGPAIEEAEEEDDETEKTWPKIFAYFLIFLCFGVGATFLALSVPHLARNGALNEEELQHRFNAIQTSLVAKGITQSQDFQKQDSSQFYALQWLTMTDGARLAPNDPRLPSRYAFAVFFYTNHPGIAAKHSTGERHLQSQWRRQDKWMTRSDVCTWYGVECDTLNNNNNNNNDRQDVLHWNMTDNNLKGSIPSEIKALSNLESMDLSANHITGTIPELIYEFKHLKTLMLGDNGLTGSISNEIGYFYPAEHIDLSKNKLGGFLPKTIGTTVNLRQFNVEDNGLRGTIPDMARLTQLEVLNLNLNKFVGKFPSSLTTLSHLSRIRMEGNQLSGSLPATLDALSALEILCLGHNRFNGEIPDVFQGLNNLTEVRLQKNLLQHKLPPSLGSAPSLKRIMLDSNRLVGSIPPEWMALTQLEALIVHKNQLSGSIKSDIGYLVHLHDLWLNDNAITGEIPTHMGLLTSLTTLYLQKNSFAGTLPTELGLLEDLQALRVASTDLSGVVPDEVCALKGRGELEFVTSTCSQLRCVCCDKCS